MFIYNSSSTFTLIMSVNEHKVIFIGDFNTGKTQTLNYLNGIPFDETYVSQGGFCKRTLSLSNTMQVTLNIVDVVEQQLWRSLKQFKYKDAIVGVVFFSVIDE